jgi:Dictyostelium (slime mold) repeat
MRFRSRLPGLILAGSLILAPAAALGWNPVIVAADALAHMPGTQPAQGVGLQPSNSCFNCHAGYGKPAVDPGFSWRGSMMGQAARDPLFWPAFAVAVQDSIYAFGRPNAADACERCHLPSGWLEGRSDPPNAAKMTDTDFDGVGCDGCHRMFDPFFADTAAGTREGNDWIGYWDETLASMSPSDQAAANTLTGDINQSLPLTLFDNASLYDASHHLVQPGYTENASGQYFVSTAGTQRGPFADATPMHSRAYSRYHKSKFYCSTCHDISNEALANLAAKDTPPGDGKTVLPSESEPSYAHPPLERTFSEFMLSDYGLQGGAPGSGAFAPGAFKTSHAGDVIATCQDCHMPDAVGAGCKNAGTKVRPMDSVEHPLSGQPVHDLTGGNALVPFILASTVQGSPGYDAQNAALLGQGAPALTLVLDTGVPLDAGALLAARNRALLTLGRAATIDGVTYDPASGAASFRITNHTGHKLLTGYAEGRRMFVNVRLWKKGALLHEVNPYDAAAGTLRGLWAWYSPNSPALGAGEEYDDALVYEAHTSSSVTAEAQTYHFALADGISKDNRIPPRGFRIAEAAARKSEPAWLGAPAPGLFTAAEYTGGWDDVALALPPGGEALEVTLYYQTTSREYVEFLRDEINGTATTLASPTPSGEPKAYIAKTDPFFGQLSAWGDTAWQLWLHNKDVPGAAPIAVAAAVLAIDPCSGAADGTACNDGDFCTTGDVCAGGVCTGGAALGCDDGNGCTDDSCDPQKGCAHAFTIAACDDGDPCTNGDSCAFGVCVGGPATDCSDGDACTNDTCMAPGGCVHTPINGCGMGGGGGMEMTTGTATSTSTATATATSTASATGTATSTATASTTATGTGEGGATSGATGTGGGASGGGGCGCSLPGDPRREGALALAALGWMAIARRRRARA